MENSCDTKIIRSAFKICYYYILSFLCVPIKLESYTISLAKNISDEIEYLYQILLLKFDKKLIDVDKNNSDQLDVMRENPITTEREKECNSGNLDILSESKVSKMIEFNSDHKIYSLKIDSIGRYALKSNENALGTIHVDLKNKEINIITGRGIDKLHLYPKQIIISDKRSNDMIVKSV
jgi:hypothetical protein